MLYSLAARLVAVGSLEMSVMNLGPRLHHESHAVMDLGPHPHESHAVIKPEVCHHLVEQPDLLQELCTGESRSKTR